MKSPSLRALFASLAGAAAALTLGAGAGAGAAQPRVLAIEFENDVNPVTADYVTGELERAESEGYDAAVILLDTPGGLDTSMREIIRKELALQVPVIVYVSPDGARAGSAGAFITMAADVAAMAPQTNIGSATPVSLEGQDISRDLRNKVVNDAAEYIAALAEEHERNAAVAADFVRKGSNLRAREALERNVIDVVAPTLPALLEQIDGRTTEPKDLTLNTAGAQIDRVEMSFWKEILDVLIDPNILLLLLSVGALGIIIELYSPGLIFPGTIGGISLILGLFGLSVLPISWAGVLLMILAAGFFGAELFVPSHGALTLAGAASFVLGALLLFDPAGPAYEASLTVVLTIAGLLSLFMAFVVSKIVQVRRRPVTVGMNTIVGERGRVRRDGYVLVRGELWRASTENGEPLRAGEEVVVEAVEDGLALRVRPVGA